MAPILLLTAFVIGAVLVFGHSAFVVGFALMAGGLFGLITFMGATSTRWRPGEEETVIEERHYIGKSDDHRNYRH